MHILSKKKTLLENEWIIAFTLLANITVYAFLLSLKCRIKHNPVKLIVNSEDFFFYLGKC